MPQYYREMFLSNCTILRLQNLVRCALEAQVSPDTRTKEGPGSDDYVPVLIVAACRGATPALKALLAGGASIDLADKNRDTALAWAARNGHLSFVQLLLDSGASTDAQDNLGNTPLTQAELYKHLECARALLPASQLGVANLQGVTAFHLAVLESEACFELLLPVMSDVDVRTVPEVDSVDPGMPAFNMTALHFACLRGHLPMCKALLSRGADRMVRDCLQRTPLHYATVNGHFSCVVMLVGRPGRLRMTPANVDAADEDEATALLLTVAITRYAACSSGLARGWTPRIQTVTLR